jgi:hypothetical protein
MKELVNLTTRALPLSDGTMLAAKGTDGSVKQVESISDDDARRLGNMICVREVESAGKDVGRTVRRDVGASATSAVAALEETKR